jgi:hypothetical protein
MTIYGNYRAVTLLCAAYEIQADVLCIKLVPFHQPSQVKPW